MSLRAKCPACAASYEVSDDLKGKNIRCKDCRKPFVVGAPVKEAFRAPADEEGADDPVEGGVEAPTKTASKTRPRPRPADEEEDSGPARRGSRPRKRRRAKGGIPLWVWLAAAGAAVILVLLIGGGVGAYFLLIRNGVPGAGGASGGALTQTKFKEVRNGMSEADVAGLLGAPTTASGPPANRDLTWDAPATHVEAKFIDGKLLGAGGRVEGGAVNSTNNGPPVAPTTSRPSGPPASSGDRVNMANYKKLDELEARGQLTQAKAEEILGPGHLLVGPELDQAVQSDSSLRAMLSLAPGSSVYQWSKGRERITMLFNGGMVGGMSYSNN